MPNLVLLAVVLAALNMLLLLPGFVFRHDAQDVTPFFPRAHPHGAFGFDLRSFVEYPAALLLRRPNLDVFRVVVEWWAWCVLTLALARTRLAKPVRVLGALAYVSLLFFLVYEHAFAWFFRREPVVTQDWVLLLNLWQFLVEMRVTGLLAGLAAVASLGAVTFAIARALRALQELAPPLWRWALPVGLLWCLGSLAWFGVTRDDPVVQLVSKRVAWDLKRSRLENEKWAAAKRDAPDRRYDDFARIRLTRKPDVSLLVVEAYGEILATWDMTTAYRALMERVEARLAKRGLFAATITSAAPVHGGFSWFSLATMQSGMLIDRPESFTQVIQAGVPTLSGFMAQQGYFTVAIQPGTSNKAGVGPRDWVGHSRFIGSEELDYSGKAWGFGRIPDQYALVELEKQLPGFASPRFIYSMSVSTHFPWGDHVPPYLAREVLPSGVGADLLHDETWAELPGTRDIAEYRASYFKSVEYEFRVLTEFIERDPSKDLLIIIVGDHQPRLESNAPGEVTLNTPVHVLTTDPATLELFLEAGATKGMMPKPGATMAHEGLFSLIVWAMAQAHGDAVSKVLGRWSPDGAQPSGLYR